MQTLLTSNVKRPPRIYFYNILLLTILSGTLCDGRGNLTSFPSHFLFGVGSSAYQIEGAWNTNGKGESIWDRAAHTTNFIVDHATGDIAADSYHKWQDDIQNLKRLKVHCYRFSLAWTRLFPNGTTNNVNQDGVDYYNNLINGLLAEGITPLVTLYHWDTPQQLQDLGGWTNPLMINWYVNYADKVFEMFGDRVRTWSTMNEPANYCRYGYARGLAPFLDSQEFGDYLCAHHIILAHARTYRLYQRKYKATQHGIIGLALSSRWAEPKDPKSMLDRLAARVYMDFELGWFAWPICKTGAYPKTMRTLIDYRSRAQNYPESRLPYFTASERREVLGTCDYLGINHYSTEVATFADLSLSKAASWPNDANLIRTVDPKWPKTGYMTMTILPQSLRKLITWVGEELGPDVKIDVTENGYAGKADDDSRDTRRIDYLNSYLQALLEAMSKGINVIGYTWWSGWDNFEWTNAYGIKFGLYDVDFNDPNRTRTPRRAAYVFAHICKTKKLHPHVYPTHFYPD